MPLKHMIVLQQPHLLGCLFGRVVISPAVWNELQDAETPEVVRRWIASPPAWLKLEPLRSETDARLNNLDPGAREAILLAQQLRADQVLLDDQTGREEAARLNLPFSGTLEVLLRAAQLNWIDLRSTLALLQRTTFVGRDRRSLFKSGLHLAALEKVSSEIC